MSTTMLLFLMALFILGGGCIYFFLYHLPNRNDDELMDHFRSNTNK